MEYKNTANGGFFNYSIKVTDGCKGCGNTWGEFPEGQCYKCKRCYNCCGSLHRMYSCAWKYERDYGGMSIERVGKRIAHNRRVDAGIRGYMKRMDGFKR